MQMFRDNIKPAILKKPSQEEIHRKVQEESHKNFEHQVISKTPDHGTQYVGSFSTNLFVWNNQVE
jgi:hypothetical protein